MRWRRTRGFCVGLLLWPWFVGLAHAVMLQDESISACVQADWTAWSTGLQRGTPQREQILFEHSPEAPTGENTQQPLLSLPTSDGVMLLFFDASQQRWQHLRQLKGTEPTWGWSSPETGQRTSWSLATPAVGQWHGQQVIALASANQLGVELYRLADGKPQLTPPLAPWSGDALPAALTLTPDGDWDRLYQVDRQGRLYRVDLTSQSRQQLADLSDSGFEFGGRLQALRSRWQNAAGHWQQGDLVIMQAKANPFALIVLSFAESDAHFWRWSELMDASDSANLAAGGWWRSVPASPVLAPEVLAGVVYQPLQQTLHCQSERQLLAVHLHQGQPVYPQFAWSTHGLWTGAWQLQLSAPDRVSLWHANELLVPQLRQIDGRCARCSRVLQYAAPASSASPAQWLGEFIEESGSY